MTETGKKLKFRQAAIKDFDECWRVVDAARNKMIERDNLDQWTKAYPSEELIREDVMLGIAHVVTDDDRVVCYGAVTDKGEPAYTAINGKWLSQGRYLALHRLAVDPMFQRNGYGRFFFKNVEILARNNKFHSVKVDTHRANSRMISLLNERGFSVCGIVDYGPRGQRIAFEKVF